MKPDRRALPRRSFHRQAQGRAADARGPAVGARRHVRPGGRTRSTGTLPAGPAPLSHERPLHGQARIRQQQPAGDPAGVRRSRLCRRAGTLPHHRPDGRAHHVRPTGQGACLAAGP
ncbi:hypothetical protein G6F65_020904 [Rhizopus arrhizus]|nr:hypothetical protein G6F65_020904 [Rhizopus arrhizus]